MSAQPHYRFPPASAYRLNRCLFALKSDDAFRALGKEGFDSVFHLASAVSCECEADFDLGLRSNLDTTRVLLDALRAGAIKDASHFTTILRTLQKLDAAQ